MSLSAFTAQKWGPTHGNVSHYYAKRKTVTCKLVKKTKSHRLFRISELRTHNTKEGNVLSHVYHSVHNRVPLPHNTLGAYPMMSCDRAHISLFTGYH